MKITENGLNKVIAGTTLSAHLQHELTLFAGASPAGATLLNPILAPNSAYEVVFTDKSPTATNGTRVTLNLKETKVTTATTLLDLREIVESAIFELTNASNSAGFATLENNLLTGAQSVHGYGRAKSDLEAEATWNVHALLTGRGGYVPSTWGQKQIDNVAPHFGAGLPAFRTVFQGIPHDRAAEPNTAPSLQTAEFYAYNGIGTLVSRNKLDVVLPNVTLVVSKKPTKNISLEKLKQCRGSNEANSLNRDNPMRCNTYYNVLVEHLAAQTGGATLAWPLGGVAEWQPTDRMRAVAKDPDDVWKNAVGKWLREGNAAIVR